MLYVQKLGTVCGDRSDNSTAQITTAMDIDYMVMKTPTKIQSLRFEINFRKSLSELTIKVHRSKNPLHSALQVIYSDYQNNERAGLQRVFNY